MDFAQARIVESGNQLHVTHGDDSRLYVEFTMEAIHQTFESEKEGRPIFKDIPHIRIHFPGDRTKQIFRPVKFEDDYQGPADPRRFPNQWRAFDAQQEQVQTGTPIEHWGPLTKSQAMEFKAMHIHTVEQLAGVSDANLGWLGARELRDKAISWLAQAESGKEALRLQGELEKRDADIEELRRQVKELASLAQGGSEKPKK
ncbi:chromosome partitioning protein ParA [Paraburkholderia madseniana]|uniref:Chromosome partitioning protein ParA n=1 Tax=Paraburkholderia madseniana TaxID=2599607 RepID=A0A6N6W9I2_9BURK|nr:chromosome partitioning protein ParA [Paraburkholderia madseniana]KAE8757315.1 chromosome partitioning protein ParA [Paraburkholderia madseniana]